MKIGMGVGVGFRRFRVGFSPSALFASSEPGVWYDPSDLSTLFQDSAGATPVTAAGQPVGLMLDKSGRGNHATQAIAAARPTYQTAGGLHWLAFDGVDDFMITPTITPGTDKAQVFAGVRKLSDAAGMIAESSIDANINSGTFFLVPGTVLTGGGPNYAFGSHGTSGNIAPESAATYAAPISNVLTGLGDISGDLATLRINGAQAAQLTTDQGIGNFLAYPLYIGARAGTGRFFNGNIYGFTVRFGANLTAAQIAQAETYMAGKTGFVL